MIKLKDLLTEGKPKAGDYVNDTPPTLGGAIELSGCTNNDLSCSVSSNGENYMDYNHDCKKMFTQGQVDRMTAALNLPSRVTLWSPSNLIATGCTSPPVSLAKLEINDQIAIYPNPTTGILTIEGVEGIASVYDIYGRLVLTTNTNTLDFSQAAMGIYFARVIDGQGNVYVGKILKE